MTPCFRPFLSFAATLIVMGASSALAATSAIARTEAPAPVDPPTMMIGEGQTTTTKYEDTLIHLARKYNVGFVEMRAANPGVDPWLPGAGTRITIPTQHLIPDAPHKGIVINLSEMRLYHFDTADGEPISYPIGIGRTGLTTPLGTTSIARKLADPIWVPTSRMRAEDPKLPAVVPPGPENPMGTHAMYLGWNSYAIHGTDKPYSIGRRLSSGCIRMYPEDILTLFNNVPQGTQVSVVDQPVKTAWIDNKLYIEVHPTQEQSDILSRDNPGLPEYQMTEKDMRLIMKAAGSHADELDWARIRKAMKERRGIPIIVATLATTASTPNKDIQDPVPANHGALSKSGPTPDRKGMIEPAHKVAEQPLKPLRYQD